MSNRILLNSKVPAGTEFLFEPSTGSASANYQLIVADDQSGSGAGIQMKRVTAGGAIFAGHIADNAVITTKLNNSAVTLAKVQNIASGRVLGNLSGGDAAPSEITVDSSPQNSSTTLVTSAGVLTALNAKQNSLTFGIANTNSLVVDGSPNDNEYAKFTANGLEGRTATEVKTDLGLVIGTNVQAYDADLNAIAALSNSDGNIIVGSASGWVAESGATARTSLGVSIGSDVQAYDAQLADVASLAVTDGGFIVGNGSNFVLESGATARTSLGLGTMAVENKAAVSAFTMNAAIAMGSNRITGLSNATSAQDAVTKSQLDSAVQGLDPLKSAKAAYPASFTMASTASTTTLVLANGEGGFSTTAGGSLTVDGISCAADDRVLVVAGVNSNSSGVHGKWNGVYIVGALNGANCTLTRASDLDEAYEMLRSPFLYVEQGTANGKTSWILTNQSSPNVGTDALVFELFQGVSQAAAGDGLSRTGNVLAADIKSNSGIVIDSGEISMNLGASSITGTLAVGDGGTGATSAGAARTALGLAIGSDVQAYDAQLADVAGLAVTDGGIIVGDGSNFVLESGATARTSLGVSIGSDVQAYDAGLANLAGVTMGANKFYYTSGDNVHVAGDISVAGRALIDDANAAAQRTTLGLGDVAVANTGNGLEVNSGSLRLKGLTAAPSGQLAGHSLMVISSGAFSYKQDNYMIRPIISYASDGTASIKRYYNDTDSTRSAGIKTAIQTALSGGGTAATCTFSVAASSYAALNTLVVADAGTSGTDAMKMVRASNSDLENSGGDPFLFKPSLTLWSHATNRTDDYILARFIVTAVTVNGSNLEISLFRDDVTEIEEPDSWAGSGFPASATNHETDISGGGLGTVAGVSIEQFMLTDRYQQKEFYIEPAFVSDDDNDARMADCFTIFCGSAFPTQLNWVDYSAEVNAAIFECADPSSSDSYGFPRAMKQVSCPVECEADTDGSTPAPWKHAIEFDVDGYHSGSAHSGIPFFVTIRR